MVFLGNVVPESKRCQKQKKLMSLCQKDTGALMKGFQLAKDV